MINKEYLQLLILIIYFVAMMNSFVCLKNNKPLRNVISNTIIIYTLLVVCVFSSFVRFSIPIINIKGKDEITINYNEDYVDEGYEIIHPDAKVKDSVKVKNDIDSSKIGVYDIEYSLDYYGNKITAIRKVKVVDVQKPVIELKGKKEMAISQASDYVEPGFEAFDDYDGDVTKNVNIINNVNYAVGKHKVIYSVSDSSGNFFEIERIVNRLDDNEGIIYLTFDDGPSSTTSKVLDILKKENIKATFFIVNYNDYYIDTIKRIVREGHTIGLHSYTHNYKYIYSSEDAYFEDLLKLKDKLKNTTGIDSNIIRFPGGSSNTISSFNKGIMSRLSKLVKETGYRYFDWTIDSKDAGGAKNSEDVYNNVIKNLKANRNNMVLMHDFGNNQKTVDSLEKIIKEAKEKGYSFSKITNDTKMITHGINN